MGKADALFRRSEEEKSELDSHFFDEWQLLDLENDNIVEEKGAEDVELEEIDMATSEKKNGLRVVQLNTG